METAKLPQKKMIFKAKHELLKNELRAGIVGGRFRINEPLPSENELVAEAGMSRSTVRLAIDGLEEEGFVYRIHGKGTFIKNYSMGKTHTSSQSDKRLAFNFVLPVNRIFASNYTEDMTLTPFLKSLEATLRLEKFRLSVVFFDEHCQKEVFDDLLNSSDYCDGIVLLTGILDEALATKIISSNLAHVCVDSKAERLGVNTVSSNEIEGMRQAISHLMQLGHESIAFLGAVQGSRCGFFNAAMAEINQPVIEPIHLDESFNWFNRDVACKIFGQWLDDKRTATAVICQTDGIAFGAIEAMNQRNLKAGREISIVGYDGTESRDSRFKNKPILSTIDPNVNVLGNRCGELLLNQVLRGQRQIVHEYLPVVELLVRQTSGPRYQN